MDFNDNNAIYIQIANFMLENILQKKWKEEERIPSVREVAVLTQVNPNTAMRTFAYLQNKAVIYNKRGIGYFVAADGFNKAKALKKEEFINKTVPEFFKTAKLLGVTKSEIQTLYEKH